MNQIDGTINAQKFEWQNKLQVAKNELTLREQELFVQNNIIEHKNLEIARLQKNIEKLERTHQKLITYYHDQLMSFKNEISTMKNEHIKLLKKYGITMQDEAVNQDGNIQRWLTTVKSCNVHISELERERCFLQKQLKCFDEGEDNGIAASFKKHHQVHANKIISIGDRSKKSTNSSNHESHMALMNGVDMTKVATGNETSDEIKRLKLHVIQLQIAIKQKDQQIQLLQTNRNENALIGCLESDLYLAKQEMRSRMKSDEALKDKIKLLEQKLTKSNEECEKLVHQILSTKESEEVMNLKTELADRNARIIEMGREKEEKEEMKCLFEQNEINTKIELKVATAQLNALKTENKNLRRIYITDLSPNNSDSVKYFQDLQQAYYESLRTLENQNRHLNSIITALRSDQNLISKIGPSPQPAESSIKQSEMSTKTSPSKPSSSHLTIKKTFLDDISGNSPRQQHTKSFRLHKQKSTTAKNNNSNNGSSVHLTIDNLNSFGLLQSGCQRVDDDQSSVEASISTMSDISDSFTRMKC